MNKKIRNRSLKGEIRIIGGKWRGHKLTVLSDALLRPTTDRIKETVFNWLSPRLTEASCLDCYAGSGALGFEALSRGASRVVLIEKKQTIYQQLVKNYRKLSPAPITLIHDDTLHYLSTQSKRIPFDIVFIDPPFTKELINQTVMLLEKNGWLATNSFIYIEKSSDSNPLILPRNWHCYRSKITGQVSYQLYQRSPSMTEKS